jgi:hypothetical protein
LRKKYAVLFLAVAVYVAACLLPAYYVPGDKVPGCNPELCRTTGLGALVLGPAGLLFSRSPGSFPWLSNPLIFLAVGLDLRRKRGLAIAAATGALLLSLSFFAVNTVPDAGGRPTPIVAGSGAYLWAVSMFFAFVAVALKPSPSS